jgi:hypothetical protein
MVDVLVKIVGLFLSFVDESVLRKFADMVLDFIEDAVADSENEIDDTLVLPLCKMIRKTFNIPDND